MITEQLLYANRTKGIRAVVARIGTTTYQINHSECEELTLDEESGGVWYRLKTASAPVPLYGNEAYIYPDGMITIQFNE